MVLRHFLKLGITGLHILIFRVSMANTTQNNLVIVGYSDVYWKGKKVENVISILLRKTVVSTKFRMIIKNGDLAVIEDMRNAGISVRVIK